MRNPIAAEKAGWLPDHPLKDLRHYELGNYATEHISGRIAPKYLGRHMNLRRAWVRICTHLPETTIPGTSYDILEFSTAHGAMLELWRALGHRVHGTDFEASEETIKRYAAMKPRMQAAFETSHANPIAADRPGWAYQPVIESIGVQVDLFDAGVTPYRYADKSFDYICCYQAIEAYAAPEDWGRIVAEFCRIARRAVVIGFNPPVKGQKDDAGWTRSRAAWEALRLYDENGFRNAFFELETSGIGLHPTAVKLVAV
ncbi:MAG: class I SAM-dependent methyltransferase [Pseudomonadota bacterium]